MANTFTAPFVQTYKTAAAAVTTALASLNPAIGTLTLLATAGTNGAVVTKLSAIPKGTVTASSLALFLVKSANPSAPFLIDSELMPAYTLSTTTAVPETVFTNISNDTPIRLEAGDMLYVGAQVAQAAGVVFKAEWGNL